MVYGASSNPPRAERCVGWEFPPPSFYKLNVHGSVQDSPTRAGFNGVIRSDNGSWVLGFLGRLGYVAVPHTELEALQRGLNLAWDVGIRKLISNSDSKLAVDLVSK